MAWIEPIFDRTASDVQYAKNIQSNDVNELKGALDYRGLNRIEGNVQAISDLFNSYQYINTVDVKTDWTRDDFMYVSEFNRIQHNINMLQDIFLGIRGKNLADVTFTTGLDYVKLNEIEELISSTKSMFEGMINGRQRLSFKLGTKRW